MAELDYALLAEYARIDAAGLLTVVGASFEQVHATSPNAAQQLFVALRVLLDEDEAPASVDVRITSPGGEFELVLSGVAERNPAAEPIGGKAHVLMALGVMVPLPVSGTYVVRVAVGRQARELPFVVVLPPTAS